MTKQQLKKIEIDCETRGRLVYATPKAGYYLRNSWLIIISHVIGNEDLLIKRLASYNLGTGEFFIDCHQKNWGDAKYYDFYEPSEAQIDLLKEKLKETGYKYVKGINKMFKR